MPKQKKNSTPKAKKGARSETASGEHLLSLRGFRSVQMPDVSAVKFVYSDYRVLTCSASQADYVYRCNSLFDPDATGVGGQPDGFDQWKTLYGVYRVVAVEIEVQATGNGSFNGLLAVGPADTSASYTSAEEVAGLRRAGGAAFSSTEVAKVHKLWHIGQLLGRSDETVLADPNCSAALTTNPATQYYAHVAIEMGNSASGQAAVWTKLTYYARMEVPIQTIDTAALHRTMIGGGIAPRGYARNSDGSLVPVSAQTKTASPDDVISAAAQFEVARARLAAAAGATVADRTCKGSVVPGL